ncbi:MAG: hypothetical protein ABSB40_09730 [Nitrososphaeria archaeon]|jgi:hypothetical protein
MANANRKKFLLVSGYSNVNGWTSKIMLINKVHTQNQVFIKFYADTDGKQLIMRYNVTLEPTEIRTIELNFDELKDHVGKMVLRSDGMLEGQAISFKGDARFDLKLLNPDVKCC